MKLAVVVVSYNTKDLLRQCLTAVGTDYEVIVVDNASRDGSAAMVESEFPHVRLMANQSNVGFGAANNQAIRSSDAELFLLLNSDARPEPGAIDLLLRSMGDPGVVACGGRLSHPDGSLQESACTNLTLWAVFCEQTLLEKLFRSSPVFSPYWVSGRLLRQGNGPFRVKQVMGSCLMFRPVEQFDERFFLYCEDTELCRRLTKHGDILYVPEARFVHELGASSSGTRWTAVARYNRGKELYFLIHHGRVTSFACWVINRLGALLRLLIWGVPMLLTLGLVARFRRQTALFARVLFAPVSGPPLPPDTLPGLQVPGRPS